MANKGIVRTIMADAFVKTCNPEKQVGVNLSRTARKVMLRVVINDINGVGVKYDPTRKKVKKQAADSAVVKEAA